MIYCVEDDAGIRELVVYTLKNTGFDACGFESAEPFFVEMEKSLPQLVLLDIMLPEISGIEILKKIRNNYKTKNIPVIMLTAKGTEYDKVIGLDSGADDYITK
ncbi:MAG: response regulator, partial [Oscillospiraceae bacterium]